MRGDAQRRFFIAAALQPVALVSVGMAVARAHRPAAAAGFFEAFEFAHGGQQRPAQTVLQAHVAFAARRVGFQAHPAFKHAIAKRGFTFELPAFGPGLLKACFEHVANRRFAFQGDEVPAEQQQVTPVAFFGKQLQRAVHISLRQTSAEAFDPSGELRCWRLQRGFNSDVHGATPDLVVLVSHGIRARLGPSP